MLKRIISCVLCLLLLASLALPVLGLEENDPKFVTIKTPQELLELAENCRLDSYSRDLTVQLLKDIDLTGLPFESIPVFEGSFFGNGHTISGIEISHDGSVQGLFRYLSETALVQELKVTGRILPKGSQSEVGGIAGVSSGRIVNCGFQGEIAGGEHIGGIAGINAVSGIIENCQVQGTIHGNHFVGGIAGTNYGVIRSCENTALVNTTPQANTVDLEDITIESLTNSEASNTSTDIGGIAGISTGVIRSCVNRADVGYQHMGYNVGGIAGTQSGYITGCQNHGLIQGRKEVGGIVGQMEPVNFIAYSTDTFQILKEQLGEMSVLVNKATANAQGSASGIGANLGALWEQTQTAREAIESVLPGKNDTSLPDMDTILAAQATLSSAISAMPATVSGIASSVQATVSGLSRDMKAVTRQINAMGETLNEASETLGGSILDISDGDSQDMLTGKVELCENYGGVLGDLNIGGIAGAMAMENDLDILEDWTQVGDQSLNFESQVRAVVLRCNNFGSVSGKTQNIGGIAGWQSLGLVKQCINSGEIIASGASYVGGVSGWSTGFIRECFAKCLISGNIRVGGIAGSASIVSDCRSMVIIRDASEQTGAVLGISEETDAEEPIRDNFYFSPGKDIGGIDGISYDGQAQGLSSEVFIELPGLPEMFQRVYVTFVYPDGQERVLPVAPGGKLTATRIPSPPELNGIQGYWDGLEETDLSYIPFDMTFQAAFTPFTAVIQTPQTEENGLPILLLQGDFLPNTSVSIENSTVMPHCKGQQTVLSSILVNVSDASGSIQARLYAPEENGKITVLVRSEGGSWETRVHSRNGSYLVFDFAEGDRYIAVVCESSQLYLWIAAGGGLILVLLIVILIRRKTKGSKKADKK